MTFLEAPQSVLKKYADFSGRSARSEYWYWVLFASLVSILLSLIDSAVFGIHNHGPYTHGPLETIFELAVLIPGWAVWIRRLHDVNRTGWWTLLAFTIIGIIPLLYWACQPGTPGENKYGGPAPTKV